MDEEYIVTVTLPGTPEHFSKVCRGTITVGRNPEVDIQLVHPMVSRRHVELSLAGEGQFLVSDLGSRNGTVVNDELVQDASRQVASRAMVQVGPYVLQLATNADIEAETFRATMAPTPGRVALDRSQHLLLVDGQVAVERLTGLEYRLVEVLADANRKLVENQVLGDAVWGAGLWDTYMLHNLVRRVRRKLEEHGLDADQVIVGVPRAGYRVA
ncbi:MAG TPA: FHA domain-containing protein [Dehalococcoidia bacterium]|nr:FHA domain-containing protein [Dehalococcoidia bacterium]